MTQPTGIVFDIQHYAVHDGPGIRTLVFLKGCPLRCAWCCNPESQASEPRLRRIAARCQACLKCVDACPVGALTGTDGRIQVDWAACARCDGWPCVEACCSQALSVVGSAMDVDTVVARVAADREFYDNSGGGVTFSGGEPFSQPEFLLALLGRCRAIGIHTAVETCGHVGREALLRALPLVDLWLFDLKLAECGRHRLLTGVDNALILDNLAVLAAADPERIVLRVPLIPGSTDDRDNLAGLATRARSHGLRRIQVQSYHPLGRDKYSQIGRPVPPDVPHLESSVIERALALFAAAGLHAELS